MTDEETLKDVKHHINNFIEELKEEIGKTDILWAIQTESPIEVRDKIKIIIDKLKQKHIGDI